MIKTLLILKSLYYISKFKVRKCDYKAYLLKTIFMVATVYFIVILCTILLFLLKASLDILNFNDLIIKYLNLVKWNSDLSCSFWGEVNRFCEDLLFYLNRLFDADAQRPRSRTQQVMPREEMPIIEQPPVNDVPDEVDLDVMGPGIMEEIPDDEPDVGDNDDTKPNIAFLLVVCTGVFVVCFCFATGVIPPLVV